MYDHYLEYDQQFFAEVNSAEAVYSTLILTKL